MTGCSGYTRALQLFAADTFGSVALPKELIIKNSRLGMLFKVLQVMFFLTMVAYCVINEVWQQPAQAEGWASAIWSLGVDEGAARGPDPVHCADPGLYNYDSSYGWSLRPQGCRNLPMDEAVSKGMTEKQLFITTLVQDTTVWRGTGAVCNQAAKLWCEGGNKTMGLYTASAGDCSCVKREEYFARDAEGVTVFFTHGYEVDTSGGRGLSVMQGSSSSPSVLEGPRGQMVERPARMVTEFRREDGTICEVGGKQSWENSASSTGIAGTLGEFLACAGVTLDTDPRSIRPAGGLAPHLRTMGVSLELQLHHTHNELSSGTLCTVRVRATPLWSWMHLADTVRLPGPDGGQRAQHSRYSYGVAISMKEGGQFYTFDMVKFVTALTSLLVILQIPRYITQVIALYCLGLTSEIYRSAKRARMNIFEHFHGAVARMLLAEIGFRGLMGGVWSGKVTSLSMTEGKLLRHIYDAFHQQIEQGILQADEVQRMAHIIFKNMDVRGTGKVDCGDFISSCTANDAIDIHSMAQFFDDDKEISFVQQCFDNTDKVRQRFTLGQEFKDGRISDLWSDAGSEDKPPRSSSNASGAHSPGTDSSYKRDCSIRGMRASHANLDDAGQLEADDVRILMGEGLDPMHKRLCELEALDLPLHLRILEERVAEAVEKAEAAALKTTKSMQRWRWLDSRRPEPEAPEVQRAGESGLVAPSTAGKQGRRERDAAPSPAVKEAEADGGSARNPDSSKAIQMAASEERELAWQVSGLSSRVQQLEDAITLMQANLESRTAELEATLFREAPDGSSQENFKLCRSLEERIGRLEADLLSEHRDSRLSVQPQQPSAVSSILAYFPPGRRVRTPTEEGAPAESARRRASPGDQPATGMESGQLCDPILARSLKQSRGNGTVGGATARMASAPPAVRAAETSEAL